MILAKTARGLASNVEKECRLLAKRYKPGLLDVEGVSNAEGQVEPQLSFEAAEIRAG